MAERPISSIDQEIASVRERLSIRTLVHDQVREEFVIKEGRAIQNNLFATWEEVRKLDLEKQIWQIVAFPQDYPRFIMLLDGTKYVDPPKAFCTLVVSRRDGSYSLKDHPFNKLSLTPTEPEHMYKYGLWALRALDIFLKTRSTSPRRSSEYYEQLRTELKERFGNKGLKRLENMGGIKEEDILGYEEAQVVLHVLKDRPQDLDEALKMYPELFRWKIITEIRNYGYIQKPDMEPYELTQKAKDYLASKREE